ncbi:MAG: 2Fe-2S iron-sulfur cluster binding domain-containing protein [Nitriliruptorales bacterium]|nr:2Fe-2S iron-sulfur cluster binding domain-containing protein [Nitriliruptorales bacterium]
MTDSWVRISTVVNGKPEELAVPADRCLVTVLRDDLGLTGTKIGCEVGVCGACTVLVDGRPTSSCLTLAVQVDGAEILTVEGLGRHPELQELQQAFIEQGGFQCGFCTSGQLVALASLVLENRLPSMNGEEVAEHLHGNLCRCTGYYGILRAAAKVAG